MIEVILSRYPRDKKNHQRAYDRWNAYYKGELIVEGAVDPEHAACRFLLASGTQGKVFFRHQNENYVSMILDIEKGAGKRVSEEQGKSVRVANWHG